MYLPKLIFWINLLPGEIVHTGQMPATDILTRRCVWCSGEEDKLMKEIPTAVVDKLPMGLDQGFVVLNRPYGFLQWVRKHLPHIKEAYILMIEPDYIFMRPPPLLATPTQSAAYHFTYMLPDQNEDIIQPYNEKGVPFGTILPIGASYDPTSAEPPYAVWHLCTLYSQFHLCSDHANHLLALLSIREGQACLWSSRLCR